MQKTSEMLSSIVSRVVSAPLRGVANTGLASQASQRLQAGCRAAAQRAGNTVAGQPELLYSVAGAPEHFLPGHVERPERVTEILSRLRAAGIIGSDKFEGQLAELAPVRPATVEEVGAVHSYVEELEHKVEHEAPAAVADFGDADGVTYVTKSSFDDALLAAGTALRLVDAVVAASKGSTQGQQGLQQGQQQAADMDDTAHGGGSRSRSSSPTRQPKRSEGTAGFGITRPPGHHATSDTPLGYCLFNNVALAARHAQRQHGLEKVLILDIDLHHGNGTAEIFADDPSVLFIDTHEASSIYPPPFAGGSMEDVGEGAGRGATINVPLPRYAAEACMLHVFEQVVEPAARRFAPGVILVSAGYDAHWRDPFQQLQLRSSTYHKLASRLAALAAELCQGRLVFLLEGGYETEAVGEAVAETFLALLGQESVEARQAVQLPHAEPLAEVQQLVARLRQVHSL